MWHYCGSNVTAGKEGGIWGLAIAQACASFIGLPPFHLCSIFFTPLLSLSYFFHLSARNGHYKLHFATQIWTSEARPTPLCKECCPYGPTAFHGQGGTLCDCGAGDLVFHNPPLVFDIYEDPTESRPLKPSDTPHFSQIVEETLQVVGGGFPGARWARE